MSFDFGFRQVVNDPASIIGQIFCYNDFWVGRFQFAFGPIDLIFYLSIAKAATNLCFT